MSAAHCEPCYAGVFCGDDCSSIFSWEDGGHDQIGDGFAGKRYTVPDIDCSNGCVFLYSWVLFLYVGIESDGEYEAVVV